MNEKKFVLSGIQKRYIEMKTDLQEILAESASLFCKASKNSKPSIMDSWYSIARETASVISMAATGEHLGGMRLILPKTGLEKMHGVTPLLSIHEYGVNVVHTMCTMDCCGLLCIDRGLMGGYDPVIYYGLNKFSWARSGDGVEVNSLNEPIQASEDGMWSTLDSFN